MFNTYYFISSLLINQSPFETKYFKIRSLSKIYSFYPLKNFKVSIEKGLNLRKSSIFNWWKNLFLIGFVRMDQEKFIKFIKLNMEDIFETIFGKIEKDMRDLE